MSARTTCRRSSPRSSSFSGKRLPRASRGSVVTPIRCQALGRLLPYLTAGSLAWVGGRIRSRIDRLGVIEIEESLYAAVGVTAYLLFLRPRFPAPVVGMIRPSYLLLRQIGHDGRVDPESMAECRGEHPFPSQRLSDREGIAQHVIER